MLTLVIVVTVVAALVLGFKMGYNARQKEEHREGEQRRIGAMMAHWHGHTSHRGHTIVSPLHDVEETGNMPPVDIKKGDV